MAFPRIMRLSYRIVVWNAGHQSDSLDAKLKRVPGGKAELMEIADYVMPGMSFTED